MLKIKYTKSILLQEHSIHYPKSKNTFRTVIQTSTQLTKSHNSLSKEDAPFHRQSVRNQCSIFTSFRTKLLVVITTTNKHLLICTDYQLLEIYCLAPLQENTSIKVKGCCGSAFNTVKITILYFAVDTPRYI